MDIGEQQRTIYAEPTRTLLVALKDKNGDWETYEAIEIHVAQPIVIQTGGLLAIKAKAGDPEGARPQETA